MSTEEDGQSANLQHPLRFHCQIKCGSIARIVTTLTVKGEPIGHTRATGNWRWILRIRGAVASEALAAPTRKKPS